MATLYCDNTTYAEVSGVVSSADSGDTVHLPTGSSTWSTQLVLSKGITLEGNGIGNTVITNACTGAEDWQKRPILIQATDPTLNETYRVTGFSLTGTGGAIGVYNTGRTLLSQLMNKIRIDHNRFYGLSPGIVIDWIGMIYGCIDNNIFYNNAKFLSVLGDLTYPWNVCPDYTPYLPVGLGTGNMVVFEDNTIEDTSEQTDDATKFTGGWGGRYCLRYNSITLPSQSYLTQVIDAHGNQEPVTGPYAPGGSRGVIALEVYENEVAVADSVWQFLDHRGGQAMVYNNTLTGGVSCWMQMREEDKPGDRDLKSDYPGYDNHIGSYYWGNTLNGSPLETGPATSGSGNTYDSWWIQEERDYHLHSPSSETYTAYTYPHPLRGEGTQIIFSQGARVRF